ncbi:hypothetical protein Bbelb_394880 [Branchiostoma belcheri]|nr:hypothetical protein Bbelb_394880 [Branchiostoma belcheri]
MSCCPSHTLANVDLAGTTSVKTACRTCPYQGANLNRTTQEVHFLVISLQNSVVAVNGYTLYRRDRSRQGGGVGVYVRQTIPSQRRSDLERDDLEVCCVEVKPEKARKTILACVYRPPNSDSKWRDSAESLVRTLSQTAEDENVDDCLDHGGL